MNSFTEEDPTLPVDFEGSVDPGELTEVTFGHHSHMENPDGSIPMVAKASSGRMSPVRARTMKEYEQQIADLNKENFSLKLRIYFLEERMAQKFEGGEDLQKINIDLKVETENLKKQLSDKQELLKKASSVLGSISSQQKVELEQVLQTAQRNNVELQEKLRQANQELEEHQRKLEECVEKNRQLEAKLEGTALLGLQEENNELIIAEKDRIIEELRADLEEKEQALEDLELEKEDLTAPLQDALNLVKRDLEIKEQEIQLLQGQLEQADGSGQGDSSRASGSGFDKKEIQELLQKYQIQVGELERAVDQMTQDLTDKDNMIGGLEDIIKDRDKEAKEIQNTIEEMEKELKDLKDNALKRDKAIQGLTLALQAKTKEVQQLSCQLEEKENSLEQLKEDLHEVHMEKYQGVDEQLERLQEAEEKLSQVEEQLRDMKLDHERLQKTVSRREAEVTRLTNQLQRADEALKQREDVVQDLRFQIQEEKNKSMEKSESLDQHYQVLLEDTQRQLQNKEKMLQRLTRSLQDKDKQLQEYIARDSESPNESRDGLINSLRERLKERDQALQDGIEDKFKCIEEKDAEIRQQKLSLRERERDIERANQMLLSAEETIDSLQNEIKEKDQNMKQLANALKAQQRALEDASDTHSRAIEEKESIIKRLQNSVTSKDSELREAFNQSPSAKEAIIQQLQERLQTKDKLLEEVMDERSKAALSNEQATKELLTKLHDKDQDIKDLTERHNAELAEQNRDLQKMQTELNKKDYDLQTIENRASWAEEQQQEMLDKMRAALNEKDKTIEALVESGREKDKLFRQMMNATPNPDGLSASKLAEIQMLKDDVARLQNELQNREDLIERLRTARDSRSPHAFRQLEQQLRDTEQELALAYQEAEEAREQLDDLRATLQSGDVDVDEVAKLKKEIVELRQQIDESPRQQEVDKLWSHRPRSSQRLQTTGGGENSSQVQQALVKHLNDAEQLSHVLKAEQQVYQRLKQNSDMPVSERERAFEIELAAVQALRKQLEEGVQRNNKLRLMLQSHMEKPTPITTTGGDDKGETLESLRSQLEEAQRWNASLQTRLEQQNTRAGGVGRVSSSVSTSKNSGEEYLLRNGAESLDEIEIARMSSPELRETVHSLKSQLSSGQSDRHAPPYRVTQLSSLHDDDLMSLSEVNVEQMSSDELKNTIHRLQARLSGSGQLNTHGHLTLNEVSSELPRYNDKELSTSSRDELKENIQQLQSSLVSSAGALSQVKRLEEEVQMLRGQLEHSQSEQRRLQSDLDTVTGSRGHSDGEDSLDGLSQKPVSEMRSPELRQSVKTLRSQLRRAYSNNQHLQEQLNELSDMRNDIPGQTDEDAALLPDSVQSVNMLKQRIVELESQVSDAQLAKESLKEQLNSIMNAPTSGIDVRVVPVLRQQLEDTAASLSELKQENQTLREKLGIDDEADVDYHHMASGDQVSEMERLRKSLAEAEHVNVLLKRQIQLDTQTDKSPSGFNPELIVQMAEEIERLKAELEAANKEKINALNELAKPSKLPQKSQIPTSKNGKTSTAGTSATGRPVKGATTASASAALQSQMEAVRSDLNDALMQNKILQGKLASTESLVRNQTEKVRYYRGLLEEAGLAPKSPTKSRSESNLSTLAEMSHSEASLQKPSRIPRRVRPVTASTSHENLSSRKTDTSPGSRDMSPATSLGSLNVSSTENYGQTDNVKDLKDQMKDLLDQIDRYKRMIRSLQTKPRPLLSPSEGVERATSPHFMWSPQTDVRKRDQSVSPQKDLLSVSSVAGAARETATSPARANKSPSDRFGSQKDTPNFEKTFEISTPDVNGGLDDTMLAANREAFRRLQCQVDDLKDKLKETEDMNVTLQDQLREAHDHNATMQDQLNATMAGYLTDQSFLPLPQTLTTGTQKDKPLDTHDVSMNTSKIPQVSGAKESQDIAVLRKQLSDSQNMCSSLRTRLEELAEFLSEMLPQDEDGEVTFIDITPDRVSALKDILHQSMDMCSLLNTNLEDAVQEDIDDGDMQQESAVQQLQQKHAAAVREIDDLRLQLQQTRAVISISQNRDAAVGSSSEDSATSRQETARLQQSVTAANQARKVLEQDNLQLKKTIAELQKTEQKMQKENEKLKQQMKEETQKMAASHQRQIQEYNKEKQKMAASLQKQMNEYNVEKQKMAASYQKQIDEYKNTLIEQEKEVIRLQKDTVALKKEIQYKANQEQVLLQVQTQVKKECSDKMQENQILRELLKKNQTVAEQTRDKLQRMSNEVNKKNDMIAKLQDRIRHQSGRVSGNRGPAQRPRPDDLSHTAPSHKPDASHKDQHGQTARSVARSNESLESVERARHKSAGGVARPPNVSSVYSGSIDDLSEENVSAHSQDKSRARHTSDVQPSGMDMYHSMALSAADIQHRDVEGSQTEDDFNRYITQSSSDEVMLPTSEPDISPEDDRYNGSHKPYRKRSGINKHLNGEQSEDMARSSLHSSRSSLLGAIEERDSLDQVPGQDLEHADINKTKPVPQQLASQPQTRLSPVDRADYLGRYDATEVTHSTDPSHDRRAQGHKVGSDYRPVVGQSSDTETISMLRRELQMVRHKLKSAEDLNKTLKSELRLYENIKTSVGIQSSPTTGSHSSQTSADPTVTLEQHLQEIRALRKQLLQSIKNNDRLGEKLEKQLGSRHSTGSINIFTSERTSHFSEVDHRSNGHKSSSARGDGQADSSQLQTKLLEKDKQLLTQERKMKEQDQRIRRQEDQLQELHQAVSEKEKLEADLQTVRKENRVLHQQCDHLTGEIKKTKDQLKSVKEELNVAKQREAESSALNNTLQLELSMYDRLHRQHDTHNVSGGSKDTAQKVGDVDLSVLLEEIKELRLQLQRSIDTNNALRRKLEEQLDRDANIPASVLNIHHVTSTTSSQHHTASDNGTSQPVNGHSKYPDQFTDRTEKFTTDFIKDPSNIQKPTETGDPHKSGTATLWNILEDRSNSHYPSSSLIPELATQMDARSRSVSGPAGVASVGQISPSRLQGDKVTSTRSRMQSEPHRHPDQMDRLRETGSDGVLSVRDLDMNGANIRPQYAAAHDKYGHQRLPNKLSPEAHHSMTASGKGSTDDAMRYHISDIRPYPGVQSSIRVDSDLRQLFAIGKIDDYELLKKEVAESKVVLKGIESRLRENLKIYQSVSMSESLDYRILKDLMSSVENERICLDEVSRIVGLFWLSQLPVPDSVEESTSSEVKLLKQQISSLHTEVSIWKKKYKNATHLLQEARSRLKANNKMKEGVEEAICNQLKRTHLVLRHARGNLENKARNEGMYDADDYSTDGSHYK